jgi:hypothetical protein
LNQGKFSFLEKLDVPVYQTGQSGFQPMHRATVGSTGPSSAKLDVPISKTGGSRIFRISDEEGKERRLILMIGGHPWYII